MRANYSRQSFAVNLKLLLQSVVGFVHHRGQSLSSLRCYYHVDVSIKVECHEVCVYPPLVMCPTLSHTQPPPPLRPQEKTLFGEGPSSHTSVSSFVERQWWPTTCLPFVHAVLLFAWRSRECVSLSPSQTDTFDWKMARRDVFFFWRRSLLWDREWKECITFRLIVR